MRHLLLAAASIEVAWACQCNVPTPESSDAVYVGEVVEVGGLRGCAYVRVEVTESFKGVDVGEEIRRPVRLGLGGGDCSIPMPFARGEEWLFYGRDSEISLCSGHVRVEDAGEELEEMRGE